MQVALALATVTGLNNGMGRTPVLGWSSWNYYGDAVSEDLVLKVASDLHATGLVVSFAPLSRSS